MLNVFNVSLKRDDVYQSNLVIADNAIAVRIWFKLNEKATEILSVKPAQSDEAKPGKPCIVLPSLRDTVGHAVRHSYELTIYGAKGSVTWDFTTPEAAVHRINDWVEAVKNSDAGNTFVLKQIDHIEHNQQILLTMNSKGA